MKRLNSLQGLRACAFLVIFLGHCGLLGLSGMGVSIFFVLSGFLMAYNYFPRSDMPCDFVHNFKFSIRKVKKLYPLHLLMILPMLLLKIYGIIKTNNGIGEVMLSDVVPALSASVLLVQAWFPKRDIYFGFNGVAWYLSVSMFLYFIFPYVLSWMKKCWTEKKAFFSIGVVFLLQVLLALFAETVWGKQLLRNTAWFTYIFPLYRSGDFIIGCNLGYIFRIECPESKKKNVVAEVVAIIIMVCTYLGKELINIPNGLSYSAIYIPGSVACIYALARGKGIISKILKMKIFVALGNISAYTFLIHQVVINYVEILGIRNPMMPIVALSVTIVIAYGYIYLEHMLKRMTAST